MLAKDLIRFLSAIGTICAGILIFILWIIAAHDKGTEDGTWGCHGCNKIFHDTLGDKNYAYTDDLQEWLKTNRDPFSIMVAFAVIIGTFWLITGALGFFATNKMMAWVYLLCGVVTYLIFVVLFPIITERIQILLGTCNEQRVWADTKYINGTATATPSLWGRYCRNDEDWIMRHQLESFEQFWGVSLVCFILGAIQMTSAAYLIAQSEDMPTSAPAPAGNTA